MQVKVYLHFYAQSLHKQDVIMWTWGLGTLTVFLINLNLLKYKERFSVKHVKKLQSYVLMNFSSLKARPSNRHQEFEE